MKDPVLSILFCLILLPAHYTPRENKDVTEYKSVKTHATANTADGVYNQLHLASFGLSKNAFTYAYKGYQYLTKKYKLANTAMLSICDLSQPSSRKRLYIINLAENRVMLTSFVAHGKGSGMAYATRFSNRANSHQSSLGFYITGNTYYGEHGLSLRLTGLEAGFNDHATRRNIVVHGAPYIGDGNEEESKFMGRSFGCPAVPQDDAPEIINLIKNGSCLFIYHPTRTYLQKSKILNG